MKDTVLKSAAAARVRGELAQPFTISSGGHKDLDTPFFIKDSVATGFAGAADRRTFGVRMACESAG
jgi:hypothetical protein